MTQQSATGLGKGQDEEEEKEEEEVVVVEDGNCCTVCKEDVEEKGKRGSLKIIVLIPKYFLQAHTSPPLF